MQPKLSQRQIMSLMVISLMLLMENIDANIISIAIPTIAMSLHTSALNLKLAVTSYLISLAIFIPISGWIADKFGTKKVLFISIMMFVIFSLCCGSAQSLILLVTFRFLQGIAGAFMAPVGRLLLLKAFNKDDLVRVYIIMAMPVILGPLLAPLIGGSLITYLNWRYIFWVNLPIGVFGMLATYLFVDNYIGETRRFNWWSFIWLGLFLSLFSFWLDILFFPLSYKFKLYLLFAWLFSVVCYLKVELSSVNRIINYSLFKIRTFSLSFYASFMVRAAFGGRNFALALFLQISLHMTPLHSGYLLSCLAFGLFIGRMLMNKLLPYFGFRQIMIFTNIGTSLSILLFCFVREINAFAISILIIHGMFSAMSFMMLNVLIFADVSREDYAGAASIANTIQQLSVSFGVVVMASSLNLFNHLFGLFEHRVFYATFILIAALGMVNQLFFRQLLPDDGANLIKPKEN
jgi:EmrB/QacA subfamily drug resistance transporter